jgi:predicted secreted hydrolase
MPFPIFDPEDLLKALPRDAAHRGRRLDAVRLPMDELAHDWPVEWWYFAAHLNEVGNENERLTLMLTAIRGSKFFLPAATVSFFKRVDHQRGPLELLQSGAAFRLAYSGQQAPVSYSFHYSANLGNLWFASDESWTIDGQPGRYALKLFGERRDQIELDVTLQRGGPAVLLGDQGVVDYGGGHALAYYARPTLKVNGRARIGGRLCNVEGTAWYERQWGDAPTDDYAWKYVNLTLEDGERWLAFHTRLGTAERYYAMCIPVTGPAHTLRLDAAGFQNVDQSGRPLGTNLQLATPSGAVTLEVRALFPDEPDLQSIYPGVPPFWESVATVRGSRAGAPVRGWSMTELHAYV